MTDGCISQTERSGEFRGIPDLPVIVCDHGPEASERCSPHSNTELREISFDESSDEVLTPVAIGSIVMGEK